MPRHEVALSGYRAMWLFAMFDLPVDEPELRREYAQFRKSLLKEGFAMLQYSVYVHYVASEEAEQVYRRRVQQSLPSHGQVRVISLTDRQFEKMEVYVGKKRKRAEDPPHQLMLF
ncbi:MAG TPA: CRISPR-associated endonuclease Cas2 [Candidatus Aquilonibacter sp.]|nr:CRISPR-associated endonuclease Cas2 [Candidatus Aquilonibacter sp.]